jgi:NADH-quinone oxidoreductase subunit A
VVIEHIKLGEVSELEDYLPLAVLIFIAFGLAGLVVLLGHVLGPHRPTKRKSQPYESGMRPIGPGARRMPIHFYLVAVLFILFDIEIIFILPWAVILNKLGMFGLVEMLIFILFLLVGYFYAWKKGAFEWE